MILCVFAMSVLLVLMLSGRTYKSMADISIDGQNERILLSYIRTKVSNADNANQITVTDFHGLPALSLKEEIGDYVYVTLIYLYGGWVRELFVRYGDEFYPLEGIRIIRVDSLGFETADNGLIRITTGNKSALIFPRSAPIG
jgi:hypothetical protein